MKRFIGLSIWLLLAVCVVGATAAGTTVAGATASNGSAETPHTIPPQQELPDKIIVATKEIVPFVFHDANGNLTGFSIDLWDALLENSEIEYEWLIVTSVTEQLEAIQNGSADAAIAAISMTVEREELLDFSYPYFDSGLRIMTVPTKGLGPGSFFTVLFSPHLLGAIAILILLIFIIGHMIWLVERRHNKDFPKGYKAGVWEGIWWAAVTVTTVGYGDNTPRRFLGRLIGLVWMFAGLFVIANFTAAVTSQLTVNQLNASIEGANDLPGKRIATVEGSTSADWLRQQRLPFQTVKVIDEAYKQLDNGQIDAIVYDSPVLLYEMSISERGKYIVVGELLTKESYGIAIPEDSPYRDILNRGLLRLYEDGTYDAIYEKWY